MRFRLFCFSLKRQFLALGLGVLVCLMSQPGQVCAQPAKNAEAVSVLVMDLKYGQGITKDNATVLTREIATELAKVQNVRVQTTEDARVILDVDAQKQLIGCDETSCLAEIASAMGTDTLMFGRLDRVGSKVTLQLTLLDANRATPLSRSSAKDDDVTSILVRMDAILLDAKKKLNPAYESPATLTPLMLGGGIGIILGSIALVGGAAAATLGYSQMTDLEASKSSREASRSTLFWPAVGVGVLGGALIFAAAAVTAVEMSE